MMNDLRKAAEVALEALEHSKPEQSGIGWVRKHNDAKRAIRDALAQHPTDKDSSTVAMTRDDIIRLAQEASSESDYDFPNISALERFAALVAAAEREECAKVCDERERANLYGFKECAAAIRARGKTA
jgi:hypothetical protein